MTSIVVFDGECGLCNGFVAWLVRHDREERFLLAGSAGEVGREAIHRAALPADIGASTIVYLDGSVVRTRSDAVLAIMRGLPAPWSAVGAARLIPRSWRDRVYLAVASRRARVHAEDPACGVPPADLVKRWTSRLATIDDLP